nr:Unknown Function [uncultured bacterium]
MRKQTRLIRIIFAGLIAAVMTSAIVAQTPLKVCPDPASPCKSKHKKFETYDLPFTLPKTIKPNVTYQSSPFFAVILKNWADSDCDGGEYSTAIERFRVQAQKLFPGRKAFADNMCPDMGALGYVINGKPHVGAFVAVYAGETQADADEFLAKAKEKYKAAKVAKMRVSFERIEQ